MLSRIHSYVDADLNISTYYLCSGNVLGEMGLLTGDMRNASVVCETAVQVSPTSMEYDGYEAIIYKFVMIQSLRKH